MFISMRLTIFIILVVLFSSCEEKNVVSSAVEPIRISMTRIDSIRINSDTGYNRIIGAKEFYSAEQWISKDGQTVTKILKDTIGRISVLVQFRNNIRITYEEYYPEGQLKAKLPLNSKGQFEGLATYYYPDGRIKSYGYYINGFFNGNWKNFDSNGYFISTDIYDQNGQLTKTVSY